MTFLLRAPGEQETSLKSRSGYQMDASVPLRRIAHYHRLSPFLVALVVIQVADWAALLSSAPPATGLLLFSLQRGEAGL